MKLLVVGASTTEVCGIRDCAGVLEPALGALGVEVRTAWWERRREADPDRWLAAVQQAQPDAILWHYTPTAYGRRGLPTLAPRVVRQLAATGAPVFVLLHELAQDLRSRGWRGFVQGSVQRLLLARLLGGAAGAVVTTEERLRWLETRRWLPRRPLAFVGVPSNVPVTNGAGAKNGALRIGVFGFHEWSGLRVEPVAAAVAAVPRATLVLLGAPGPDSREADEWRRAAAQAGCPVEFTGVLEAPELSCALAGLDLVVTADVAGPTPRKGTLAAALAHGLPVVALDGPLTWPAFAEAGAIAVAAAPVLSTAVRTLSDSPAERTLLGERGRVFYEQRLSAAVTAERLLRFVEAARA
jgi:glycosyltransferase involved in cell wall biosynthesis